MLFYRIIYENLHCVTPNKHPRILCIESGFYGVLTTGALTERSISPKWPQWKTHSSPERARYGASRDCHVCSPVCIYKSHAGIGLDPDATVALASCVRYTVSSYLSHMFYTLLNCWIIHAMLLFIVWPIYVLFKLPSSYIKFLIGDNICLNFQMCLKLDLISSTTCL